jgi:multiple sugar transport system substrate-binding protein
VIRYRGLTWDHPRGHAALVAASERLSSARSRIAIDWDRQPLEGFESHPVEDLCRSYDLVVLDHPHIGEAAAAACLVPLEDLFASSDLAEWERRTIGRCFTSYRYAGRTWALPLDAATQVMAVRPDLAPHIPSTWADVVAVSARAPVALSLAGPHAALTFFSAAAAVGDAPPAADPEVLVAAEAGRAALELMTTLGARMPPAARGLNPIGLLELMATSRTVALCPLVYGYVNYAASHGGRTSVAFHNAPTAAADGFRGSTLGGTGLAISRGCRTTPDLLEHLRWLMSADAQVRFIPEHEGQPSRREAWHDEAVNARCNGFFRNTAETLEQAWVRPRYPGYIRFQAAASALIRKGLEQRTPHSVVLGQLQDAYVASRPPDAEL